MSQTSHHWHIQWLNSTSGCNSCHIDHIMLDRLDVKEKMKWEGWQWGYRSILKYSQIWKVSPLSKDSTQQKQMRSTPNLRHVLEDTTY